MKKVISGLMALLMMLLIPVICVSAASDNGYINVADYVTPGCGTDVSREIQNLIDNNPNSTLFFADGEYLVSSPILTPANPKKAVSLVMSDFAVLRAVQGWEKGQAVVQLGGKDAYNDTHTPGSNYGLYGGVIDGSGIANGVSINSGRETRVQNTSIKNAVVGLHIMYGANSGSSDSDITNVNIIGTNTNESIGVVLEGYDNTLTNMRIGGVYVGVHINSAGNVLRNIHPLYYGSYEDYENSCGFIIESGNNWLDYCYSDQFGTGFRTTGNSTCVLNDCFCYWYSDRGNARVAFRADKKFNAKVTNFTANMCGTENDRALVAGEPFGTGKITNPVITGDKGSVLYRAYTYDYGFFGDFVRVFWMLVSVFVH